MKRNFLILILVLGLGLGVQSCDMSRSQKDAVSNVSDEKENVNDEEEAVTEEPADAPAEETTESEVAAPQSKNPGIAVLEGKIGGKYAVVMTLDVENQTGSYYYVRSGASNTITLKWDLYIPKTGTLCLMEYTKDGKNTGEFEGILEGDPAQGDVRYEGEMTNAKGQKFDFVLKQTR